MSERNSMTISEIRKYPTVVDGVHESVYRSYQVLQKVLWMLELDKPPSYPLLIEVIDECMDGPGYFERTKEAPQ